MEELKNLSLEEKKKKADDLLAKNPHRIPAIIILDSKTKSIELSKQK